jgi:UDP-N-acetylglucosamine--N-acetylmuramyl-(pentapeptide) pyrophosphoryl-undecaprenol N-acetylglucosamine transferase
MLLIPLSAAQSRGDQLLNAAFFKSIGTARVLKEEEISLRPFSEELVDFNKEKDYLISNMLKTEMPKTPEEMVALIMEQRN